MPPLLVMEDEEMNVEKYEAPIAEELVGELVEFWEMIQELQPTDQWRRDLLGLEHTDQRILIYVVRREGKITGVCQLSVSRRLPILAEFDYPATLPEFRRKGIGAKLWGAATDDFKSAGGKAIFLGTNLADAFHLYRRLGYSKMPGSIALVKVLDGESPEAFLTDWFRQAGPATVSAGVPDDQIASYPLLISPHDWQVLDANVGLLSVRYSLQHTFVGLYECYEQVMADGDGARFAARTDDGRVVGMSTARLDADGSCSVDGFAHRYYLESWKELINPAIEFGKNRGADLIHARVSSKDYEKRKLFEEMGLGEAGDAPEFMLDGLQLNHERSIEPISVPAIRMELGFV